MRIVIVLGLVMAVACHVAGARAGEIAPAEAFGAIPKVSNVELSPNGTMLAWCDGTRSDAHVLMFDLSSGKYKQAIPLGAGVKPRSLA